MSRTWDSNRDRLRPAVVRALVYVKHTGHLPRNLHVETWSDVFDLCESEAGKVTFKIRPDEKVEEAIARHPMERAIGKLLAEGGWRAKIIHFSDRGTGRYITFLHPERGVECSIYDRGYVGQPYRSRDAELLRD